jgi:metal-responsive CopG/Arc/MetJ family transcriptional regulator
MHPFKPVPAATGLVLVSVKLPFTLVQKVESAARLSGHSDVGWINRALSEYLHRHEPKTRPALPEIRPPK